MPPDQQGASTNALLGYREDARDYKPAADILADLGVKSVIMFTGNPEKAEDLRCEAVVVSGTRT